MQSGSDNFLNNKTAHRAPRVISANATLAAEDYNFLIAIPAGAITITLPSVADDKAVNRSYSGIVISDAGGSAVVVGAGDEATAYTSGTLNTINQVVGIENVLGRTWD